MATKPRPKGLAKASGPAGKDWKVAVALGLVAGQLGYLYTRQPKRFAMSLLLGILALALSFAAAYHEMPPLDPDVLATPEGMAKLSGASGGSGALAQRFGLAPWQVDRALRDLRGWTDAGLGRAIEALAETDAQVKGGGRHPVYALERLIETLSRRS